MRPFRRTFASRISEVSSWTLMFATALRLLQAIFQSPRLIEGSGVAPYSCPARTRSTGKTSRPCNSAGLEIGGDAIDSLDDSTFVLTSEAGSHRPGPSTPSHASSHGSRAINDEQMLECCHDAGTRGERCKGAASRIHSGRHDGH